jgi:hypothetical protein
MKFMAVKIGWRHHENLELVVGLVEKTIGNGVNPLGVYELTTENGIHVRVEPFSLYTLYGDKISRMIAVVKTEPDTLKCDFCKQDFGCDDLAVSLDYSGEKRTERYKLHASHFFKMTA